MQEVPILIGSDPIDLFISLRINFWLSGWSFQAQREHVLLIQLLNVSIFRGTVLSKPKTRNTSSVSTTSSSTKKGFSCTWKITFPAVTFLRVREQSIHRLCCCFHVSGTYACCLRVKVVLPLFLTKSRRLKRSIRESKMSIRSFLQVNVSKWRFAVLLTDYRIPQIRCRMNCFKP